MTFDTVLHIGLYRKECVHMSWKGTFIIFIWFSQVLHCPFLIKETFIWLRSDINGLNLCLLQMPNLFWHENAFRLSLGNTVSHVKEHLPLKHSRRHSQKGCKHRRAPRREGLDSPRRTWRTWGSQSVHSWETGAEVMNRGDTTTEKEAKKERKNENKEFTCSPWCAHTWCTSR